MASPIGSKQRGGGRWRHRRAATSRPLPWCRRGWWAMAAADLNDMLIDEIAAFAQDPLGFVLFAFPWGEPGTVLADVDGPRQWQREVLAELGRRLREGYAGAELSPILIAR